MVGAEGYRPDSNISLTVLTGLMDIKVPKVEAKVIMQ